MFATIEELAKEEKVNRGYMCSVLRLTLLAPDLVEAILDGRQPAVMELQPLVKSTADCWVEQRRLLA